MGTRYMVRSLLFLASTLVVCCQSLAGPDDVRLVGGSNQYKGRVEVKYNGHWATVCDKNFDELDARLICHSLGIENVETIKVITDQQYGQGTGPVITDLGCTGKETNLHQCSNGHWDISTCKHSEDIGIDCQTPVYLVGSPYNNTGEVKVTVSGANYSVCSDVFGPREAEVTCRMLGFSSGQPKITQRSANGYAVTGLNCTGKEKDISSCWAEPKTVASCPGDRIANLECQTRIRLVNGTNSQSGRVEIFYNDEWGTLCDDSFDDEDAAVICRTLGLNPINAISYGSAYYGRGNGSIIIDELECNGDEPDVSQCRSNPWLSHTNCDHDEDAGVECLTEVRLVDGPTHSSGRVEVKQANKWLSFCDEDFNNNTATVICNMLGHRQGNVTVHKGAYYGPSENEPVKYTPMCYGNETDIVQCQRETSDLTCLANTTAGINCYSVTPVRLAGGWKSLVGKVEVFSRYLFLHDSSSLSWRSLCYNGFSKVDAQVVCRMLGHPQDNPSILRANNFYDFTIRGDGLSNLNCHGNEDDISDCLADNVWGDRTCSYYDFVGINCDPVTPIRLVDGPSIRAGRVELLYNNTWGRVCSNNFDPQDRDVLCRMLGHKNGSLALSTSYFSTGTGPHTVSNLTCQGSESDVSNCKSNKWLVSPCSNSPIGIALKTPIRLVNGSYERSGRVEVFHNGTWGSICADAMDLKVANVICRGVGYRFWNATVLTGSKFGEGSLSLINNLTCSGDEADISMCRGGPWAATNCSQGDAAVDCRKQVTPIRLWNTGTTPYSGEVQVFYNNRWGTISYSGITKQTVDILCLNLGYNFSRDASWTHGIYSSCSSPMVSRLKCYGNESDISECPSDVWGTNVCSSDYRLKINCLTTISLQYGRTTSMGGVQMTHNSTNGYICADGFTIEDGHVICSMLGYKYTRNVQRKNNSFPFTNNVIITGLNCTGDEEDINLCPSNPWTFYSNCSTTKAVAISCNTPVRLTDGPSPRVGKVQVMINGTWARVCSGISSSQSTYVGQVVCRVLGYGTSQVVIFRNTTSSNDENSYYITCNRYESDISLCHTQEATCANNTILGVACDTPLNLVYGRTKYMGQVQLTVSETGGISPNGLNDNDANHVCRLLGHNFTQNAMLQTPEDLRFSSKYTYHTRTVVDQLLCTGNESDIADCIPNFETWHNRGSISYNNMKINCQTPLRVVNGQPYIHGEVQLFSNNTWMSVCADEFTTEDAYVVCRMMGHSHVRNATLYEVANDDNKLEEYLRGGFQCIGDEEDVSQCNNLSWDTKQCDKRMRIDCRSATRIVDGPTPYEGRIELFVNNTWWPVCYDSGYYYAGKVLCRTAGFIETEPRITNNKNMKNISLSLTSLNCIGSEQTISECSSNGWIVSSCSLVLEVACYTPTNIQPETGSNRFNGWVRLNPLGSWQYVCADSFDDADAEVICKRMGLITNSSQPVVSHRSTSNTYRSFYNLQCHGNETDVQGCNHSNWTISPSYCNLAAVNCQPVTPVRLVDGPNNASGRIEVFYDGQWGAVCDDSFDDTDASVFCAMLGYKSGIKSLKNYPGWGQIIIDDLACTGIEKDISECPSRFWGNPDCRYSQAVSIECSDQRVKLTGGHNKYQGHVEIQYLGQWHTVCSDHMDHNDTDVICRALGVVDQQKAIIYRAGDISLTNYGSSQIQDLMCDGSEDIVDMCPSFPWNNTASYCNPRSVAINCRPHTPIRLIGGPNQYSGRVEVEYPVGSWSTICDFEFDEQDAQVICRSLGYNDKSVGVKLRSYYGHQSLSASISRLHCSSTESDISECYVTYDWDTPYGNCDSTRQAGVQCNTPLRISGGRTKYSGLLEVYYQHAWGTVCSEGFDLLDAQTVCNILGLRDHYNGSITTHEGSRFGHGSGHIVLHNLNCTGDEGDLHECGTLQWMDNTCTHEQDVTLNCRATTYIRLMNGDQEITFDPKKAGHVEGRIEVFYDGQWGTICNDHFDDDDAFVLCSMKGYIAGIYRYNTDEYGSGRGPITVDDLYCTGSELDLSECWSREWRVHDCGHDEDVAIECYYEENPDPCNKFNHRPLPHLESRYVYFNTEGQDTAYNDSRLATRWYNVGKEVMPNSVPKIHSCGTTYPVYLTGSVPVDEDGKVDRVACQVTNDSDCGHSYNISIKLCQDNTYVYWLGPTVDDHSGYCFGIGNEGQAPDFVPTQVTVTTVQGTHNFVCDFTESENNLFYSVIWQIKGDRDISLTKGYCNKSNITLLDLTEEDLIKENMKMGFKLVCSVRAYTVPGGPPGRLSDPSSSFFAGFEILTPSINMRRGETKAIEFRLTVPFSCELPGCTLNLMSFTPDYGNCNSNSLSFSSGNCGVTLSQKDATYIHHINITSAETGQYGVAGSFQVFLQTPANSRHHIPWNNIKLPAIEVTILPEADRKWRGKLCAARNDPHMYTFDGRQYEHHVRGKDNPKNTKGTFVLYKNRKYGNDVEIQHRVTPCTTPDNPAMCNCGVAVRAGRDVYVISVCDSHIDIGYKHCGDNSLTVKKEDDTTYTVYLPYGTAVRARIDIQPWMGPEGGMALDISVNPSVYDQEGNSRGLCGTLDGDPDNDFHYTDANGNAVSIEDEHVFINRWKVNETESMFSQYIETMKFNPWLFPVCVCNNDGSSSSRDILPCKSSIQTCTPGVATGTHSCLDESSRRSVRSIRQRPMIPVVPIPANFIAKQRSKRAYPIGHYTKDSATAYCTKVFSESETYAKCREVPFTHTNLSLDNCVLDILLTNSIEWSELTLQSMQDSCISTVMKNATVREEVANNVTAGKNATVVPQDPGLIQIQNLIIHVAASCKFNCNGNGRCNNGTCECNDGYGGSDCALNTTRPPRFDAVLNHGLCDEKTNPCDAIYGFGAIFLDRNLTCRLKKGGIDRNGNKRPIRTMVVDGRAETLNEVICPVPTDSRKLDDPPVPTDPQHMDDPPVPTDPQHMDDPPFVVIYDVSVSNTGEYSEELSVFVYDSSCQIHRGGTESISFILKNGTCHIGGKCYASGETKPDDKYSVCNPSLSDDQWTVITTTTTTTTTSSIGAAVQRETKLTATLDYTVTEKLEDGNVQIKYREATRKALEGLYRGKFGQDLVNVTVYKVSRGSLIIEHSVVIKSSVQFEDVMHDLLSGESTTTVSLFNNVVKFKELVVLDNSLDETTTRQTNLELKLDYDLQNADLNNANTSIRYFAEARKSLTERYKEWFAEGEFREVSISSIRRGSLIIEHTLYTTKKANDQANERLIRLIADGFDKLNFFGHEVKVNSLILLKGEKGQVCDIYTDIYGCPCEIEQGSPRCKVERAETNNSVLTIWVPVTSGLVCIILVILTVVICKYKSARRKQKAQASHSQSGYNDLVPKWIENSSQGGGVYALGSQGSAPSSYSDGRSLKGSMLPRLTTDGEKVTARNDFYSIPEDVDNVYYGIR